MMNDDDMQFSMYFTYKIDSDVCFPGCSDWHQTAAEGQDQPRLSLEVRQADGGHRVS